MNDSADDHLRKEALHLYFSEVKDTQQEAELEEEEVEHVLLNGTIFVWVFYSFIYFTALLQKWSKPPIFSTQPD